MTVLSPGGVALLHVQRLPRAAGLVLGEAEAVPARRAEGGLVHLPRRETGDVADYQAEGSPDGGVGAEAGAEAAGVGLDAEAGRHRAVDYHHLHGPAGGGRGARQVEAVAHGRLHRRYDDRKMLGLAAGHDGVDGELLQRGPRVAGLHHAQGALRVGVKGGQHGADSVLGGRHDGQPVGPALLPEVVLHGGEVSGNALAAGGELWRGA